MSSRNIAPSPVGPRVTKLLRGGGKATLLDGKPLPREATTGEEIGRGPVTRPWLQRPPAQALMGPPSLYDSYMTEMAVSEARDHLAELIDATRRSGEPVFVTRRGRRVAVILDPDVYERLLEDAEESLDLAELRAAREDDDYIPWEEVKADLGLA